MLHDIPALKELDRYAGDLQCDPFYRWLDRWFLLLQIPLGLGLYWFGEAAQVHGGGLAWCYGPFLCASWSCTT